MVLIIWTQSYGPYEHGPYDIVSGEKGDEDPPDKRVWFEKIEISRSNIFSDWVVFG